MAIIFDMDGLMVDSEPLHYQVRDEILTKHGKHMNMDFESKILGRSLREVEEMVKAEFVLEESVEWLMAEHQRRFLELIKTELKLRLGLIDLLKSLQDQKAKMAVASSQQPEYVNWVVDHFNLRPYFQEVLTAEDVNGKAKPDPGIFLKTAERLGVNPVECIVLEDTVNGILAAKAAGMKAIAVYDKDFTKAKDFPMADLVRTSLEEITLKDLNY